MPLLPTQAPVYAVGLKESTINRDEPASPAGAGAGDRPALQGADGHDMSCPYECRMPAGMLAKEEGQGRSAWCYEERTAGLKPGLYNRADGAAPTTKSRSERKGIR